MDSKLRITIRGNQFIAGGKRIWINGVNTPWKAWNDFGGSYNDAWWDAHFKELSGAGINAVRVWINCNNNNGAFNIDDEGMINSVSENFWSDLDKFFAMAARNKKYVKATLISFDHFKDTGARPAAAKWRRMIKNSEAVNLFAQKYTIPFVKRYGGNPYLWCADICNEPDWVFENPECGQIEWEKLSYFFAVNAAAIHENSEILVTVGVSFPKYNSDTGSNKGNKLSDSFLQNLYPNKNARLDFWSQHYYDWLGPAFSVPFYISPYGQLPDGFGLDQSKPAVIGECAAIGSKGKTAGTENNTIITDYENAFLNGWQGVMPWSSNGVDGCGALNDLSCATRYMASKYRDLIFPFE